MAAKSPNMAKPLALAVTLAALGGVTYWLEFSKKPKDQATESEAKKVFILGKSPIARIDVRGVSAKPENAANPPLAVSLVCDSLREKLCHPEDVSKWTMTAPLQTRADDNAVNGVLKNFGNLASTESIDLGDETAEKRGGLLKDYGLDLAARANPATRTLSLSVEGGKRYTAYFGAKHPIGDTIFALLATDDAANENRIYVVPDWQLSVFDQKTSFFRDKTLFGINEKEISSFTLSASKKISGKLEAKRTPDEKGWLMKLAGSEVEGDPDTIDGILSGVARLAAKDVLAEKKDSPAGKAAIAGAKNTYELRFRTKTDERRLRFFEKKKGPKASVAAVYAMVDAQDPIYEIDVYEAEKIEKTFDEMRIGKLISVAERYSVSAIEIEGFGAESFKQRVVKENGGRWKVGSAETGRGKVEAILDRLTSKVVAAYAGPLPTGDLLKMRFLKSVDGKDAPVAEIEFFTAKGRLYARDVLAPKKETVELAADLNSNLPWKAASLLNEKEAAK